MDVETIRVESGICNTVLLDQNALISAGQHRAVLESAQKRCSLSDLGLELGIHRSMATLDQLSFLLLSSATLREATNIGLQNQNYLGRFSGNGIVTSFSEILSEGCYQIDVKSDLGQLRLLALEDILASIVTTCRWVLGYKLPITKLRCNYPEPPHHSRYKEIFQCPVEFDAPVTQLFFTASILDLPLPQSSPKSAALYKALCEKKIDNNNYGDVVWKLWQTIYQNPSSPPSLSEAALSFNCSSRTLSRKLHSQGWRYQQLIDKVREVYARQYLSDPTLNITRVARMLGYADGSSFHRAFKKWTSLSPRTFRRLLFG